MRSCFARLTIREHQIISLINGAGFYQLPLPIDSLPSVSSTDKSAAGIRSLAQLVTDEMAG
jgi:hypothetical protein